jgi:hypothetical protein
MVNHYATLLLNLAGENHADENKSYFTAHEYIPLVLPGALRDFHQILFPAGSSFYYRQFLCYCYLRVLHAANRQADILKYDTRITYDLDALKEYFRLNRQSNPTTSNPAFNLLLMGKYTNVYSSSYYFNSYSVIQNENLPEVFIYSEIDKVFLKGDKTGVARTDDMRIPLQFASNHLTKAIPLGGTGLSFALAGDFSQENLSNRFTDTANKTWKFIVESPFVFEFIEFYQRAMAKDTLIARMINYGENKEPSYLNFWNNHFNEAYKFSGLLNLYMEKVHDIWVKNQT